MVKKAAFTLIELIFAIVIIAISVLSMPMLVQSTSKGIESNIVQEAIFASETIVNEATSYYWDGSSLEDSNATGFSRVVNTSVGDCTNTAGKNIRIGHINRQCLNNIATVPLNGAHADALENAASNYNNTTVLIGTADQATYKDSYSATVSVTNCSPAGSCTQFGLEANNPDLKEVAITITKTGDPGALVLFRSYSANIGSVKIESRLLP